MGNHVNTKKNPNKRHKRGFREGENLERMQRVSFKNYVKQLEEELLEEELLEEELNAVDDFSDDDNVEE
jgi:hypothetical protein